MNRFMKNFKTKLFFLKKTVSQFKFISLSFLGTILSIQSCTPPKSITQSGKVTPQGQVKVGMDYCINVPTHFVRALYNNVDGIVTPLVNKDTIILDEQLVKLNKTALAYAIEPLGFGYNFYGRYGIYKHFDIGYKYASGTHVIDAMYQFMGSTGTINEPGEKGMCGSIGVQYSSKKYELPDWSGLDKVQSILDFEMKRKDLMVPVIFSLPFGSEETVGNFSFGLVYMHSFLSYGFQNSRIYDTLNGAAPTIVQAIQGKKDYSSTGIFFNLKLGYKYAYFLPAFALYYQNYGSYTLIDGSSVKFKGFTYVPSLGIQINPTQIYYDIKKRKKKS